MADLDLPAGPLVAHLRAIRDLYGEALSAVRIVSKQHGDEHIAAAAVEGRQQNMDHHLREMARFTAPTHGIDFPPRPTLGEDEDGYPALPEGWASVVTGTDTETGAVVVLAGWTAEGAFVQYTDTASIVEVCTQAIQQAYAVTPAAPWQGAGGLSCDLEGCTRDHPAEVAAATNHMATPPDPYAQEPTDG